MNHKQMEDMAAKRGRYSKSVKERLSATIDTYKENLAELKEYKRQLTGQIIQMEYIIEDLTTHVMPKAYKKHLLRLVF